MATCNICGRGNKPCPVYDENISICSDCSFKLTVLESGLTESVEIMQDIFTHCQNPRELRRVFIFMGRHVAGLFEGIASEKTRRHIWKIISYAATGIGYNLSSHEFFNHPEHLETIKQRINADKYMFDIFNNKDFTFAISDRDNELPYQVPLDTISVETAGVWNIGELLVLESLETTPESDEEDSIF
ncbi:MAG: hypothetical protein JXC33_11780 [Deltaproteobacteria bacterium]|nr:hypothetical protein [Deltaproteobacteria bacterium]